MSPKKVGGSEKPKRKVVRTTIELRKEIIAKAERGVRVTEISEQYGMPKSTICTMLKNKEAIKGANVAKGVSSLSKQRTKAIEEVEKSLLLWINETQLAGDGISEAVICEKAKRLHSDIVQKAPGTGDDPGPGEMFKASRGWFDKFKKRSGIESAVRHAEGAGADTEGSKKFVGEFKELVEAEGLIPPPGHLPLKPPALLATGTSAVVKGALCDVNAVRALPGSPPPPPPHLRPTNPRRPRAGDADLPLSPPSLPFEEPHGAQRGSSGTMHAADAAAAAAGKKRRRRSINLGVKLEVVKRFEAGQKVAAIAQALGLPASSARSICVNAGKILESAQNAAPLTATKIFRSRSAVLENMERLLGVWIEDQSQRGAALSAPAVQEKARSLFEDLRQMSGGGGGGGGGAGETFGASRGWFERFKKRSGLGSLGPPGEAAGGGGDAASAASPSAASPAAGTAAGYPDVLRGVIEEGGYVPGQVFNVDETELYWKRMPARTSIAAEEKTAPGFKAAKDRLALLLAANASGDLKLKPLLVYRSETPRAIKGCSKEHLPVVWRSNRRAWVTATVFREWFATHFCPAVADYCGRRGLPNRALLVLDSAPAHPVNLEELSENVRVAFLPPSTTALLQPMDQGVVAAFKAYYLRRTFARLAGDTAGGRRSARDFWRGYNIRAAVDNIAEAWREVRPSDVNAAWLKIWPRCVVARPAGPGPAEASAAASASASAAEVLRDIVGLARSAGLDNVEERDVAELLESHGGELSNDDLVELLQQRSGEGGDEGGGGAEGPPRRTLTAARLSEAFVHLEAAMDIFREDDPNRERSFKVNRTLAGAVHCYKELYKQKKKYAARRALARLVKSPASGNAGGAERQPPPLTTPLTPPPPPLVKREQSPGPGTSPQLVVKREDASASEATAPDLRIIKVEGASEDPEDTGEESQRGCLATADQNFIEVELSFSEDEVAERPTGAAGGVGVARARPGRGRRARPARRGCAQCRKAPPAGAGGAGDDHGGGGGDDDEEDDDEDEEESDDGQRRKKRRRRRSRRRRKMTQAGEEGRSLSKGSARADCPGV
ncbi:uncharacterized protein LOC116957903 [Petromyzon marinus]|uniref:Tigger transposable element-derived protein 1-like n=1 Tax=Petromyzon marinus TaxID=7757 RepID=A0AAJ7UGW3_PETMA|nr:tigger transposable element-derived protein 1-like [Petromyzon marinus]